MRSPGEWQAYDDGTSIGIYMTDPDGTCGPQVAEVVTENLDSPQLDQARHDASMLAAAPTLYDAATYALNPMDEPSQLISTSQAYIRLQAAVNRANKLPAAKVEIADVVGMLNNLSAVFKTVMTHYGSAMSYGDRTERFRLVQAARQMVNRCQGR